MKGSFKVCEQAITCTSEMARLLSRIQIYFSSKDEFPSFLHILFNFPHAYNLTALLSAILNSSKSSQALLSIEDPCNETSNFKCTKNDLTQDTLSYEADNQSSCIVTLSTQKSLAWNRTVDEESIKRIAQYINQSCTYYIIEDSSYVSSLNLNGPEFTNAQNIHQKNLLMAFKDALFQLHDGSGPSFHQVAMITSEFSAILNSHQVILTRISPHFRKIINERHNLEYASVYDLNTTRETQKAQEHSQDWKKTWIPGFAEKGKLLAEALNLSPQNLTTIGCAYFIGKRQVNELIKFLISLAKLELSSLKERRPSSFKIKNLLANFPVINCTLHTMTPSTLQYKHQDSRPEAENLNCLELQGLILPCSIGLILKTINQLRHINILNSPFFNLSFQEDWDSLLYPEDLKASAHKPIWNSWKHFNSKVAHFDLSIFNRLDRLVPKFCKKINFSYKNNLKALSTDNNKVAYSSIPTNHLQPLSDTTELNKKTIFPTNSYILCTDLQSIEQRPFADTSGCTKLSLKDFKQFQLEMPGIVAQNIHTIRFCFRFFNPPEAQVDEDDSKAWQISLVYVNQLVSPVWDRYVYNFKRAPSNDDFVPMLRPSWIGNMKMSLRKTVVPDNSVYVVWIGNKPNPDNEEISYRIILRIGMTTRPVELMRIDRFHDHVSGVKKSLENWISNLKATHDRFASHIFPLKIRIYGVVTENLEINPPSEYMKLHIEQFLNLHSTIKSNNLISIKTFIVNPHWLYDCYHKASIEFGNETDFTINISSDTYSDSPRNFLKGFKPHLELAGLPHNTTLDYTDLPLWGWIIIFYTSSIEEHIKNLYVSYLKLFHGINASFINSLQPHLVALTIKTHLKNLKAPYKNLSEKDLIRLSVAIVSDPFVKPTTSIVETFVSKKKVIVPGFEGIPVLSFSWLSEILRIKSQVSMKKFQTYSTSTSTENSMIPLLDCPCTPTSINQEGLFNNSLLTTSIVPFKEFSQEFNSGSLVSDILPSQNLSQYDANNNCSFYNPETLIEKETISTLEQTSISHLIEPLSDQLDNTILVKSPFKRSEQAAEFSSTFDTEEIKDSTHHILTTQFSAIGDSTLIKRKRGRPKGSTKNKKPFLTTEIISYLEKKTYNLRTK